MRFYDRFDDLSDGPKEEKMEASVASIRHRSFEKQLTIAQAARELDVYYQRITYAIFKGWIIPSQTDPVLIPKSEVEKYRRERLQVP